MRNRKVLSLEWKNDGNKDGEKAATVELLKYKPGPWLPVSAVPFPDPRRHGKNCNKDTECSAHDRSMILEYRRASSKMIYNVNMQEGQPARTRRIQDKIPPLDSGEKI